MNSSMQDKLDKEMAACCFVMVYVTDFGDASIKQA